MKTSFFLTIVAACALAIGVSLSAVDTEPRQDAETDLIDQFVNTPVEPLMSYGAWRTLEASTRSMHARLTAWTSLDAEGRFSFQVVEEEGSSIIRNRVLRAALDAERTIAANGEAARGALTDDNFTFGPVVAEGDGVVRIGITPKRSDRLLLRGALHVTDDTADLLRVEGRMVKRPSFWTRRVDVTRTYGRLAGVRVPLQLDSVASVLVAGTSRFSMRYEYESVNGRPVSGRTALAKALGAAPGR